MKLFFSGSGYIEVELDQRIPRGVKYRLLSCHEEYLTIAHQLSDALCEHSDDPLELMFDSGAFTAWSKGKEVVLDTLIETYDDMLERYWHRCQNIWLISLDKIPGSPGRTADPEELDEACRISDENFEVLQKRYGDIILPVYHQNESSKRLFEIADMAPYICVSPRNDLPEHMRVRWSSEVHSLIPGKNTHGLAATGYQMMTTVPWGSVDSASWIFTSSTGSIYVNKKLRMLQVSSKSSSVKDKDAHINTVSKAVRDSVNELVESRGFTLKELEDEYKSRMVWNRMVLIDLYYTIPLDVKPPVAAGLFDL